MKTLLYSELVPWYHLLDPLDDHLDEATYYLDAFNTYLPPGPQTLLELGCGAGNNAYYLKDRFQCTLSDVSEPMLALSQTRNPECTHLLGDMRTLRLDRTFDAVFVHDAIVYMTTEAELLTALTTAFVHTRPGGVAVFATDHMTDEFQESSDLHEGSDEHRALRCLEWCWDPDPTDSTYTVEYAFLLREGHGQDAVMTAVHDRHLEGLFSQATWHRLLTTVGYERLVPPKPLQDWGFAEIIVCRRPETGER